MAEERKLVRYCGVVQLEKSAGMERVKLSAPVIVDLFERWSGGEKEMVFRSNDGQLFGFLFKSSKPPAMLRSEFDASAATRNSDSFIVFEVGSQSDGFNFTRALTWLQRH